MTTAVAERRRTRASERDEVGKAASGLALARDALERSATMALEPGEQSAVEQRYRDALEDLKTARSKEAEALKAVEEALEPHRGPPGDTIAALDGGIPIAFFPVRIETRFRRGESGTGGELRVRLYPDGMLADQHEPLLTLSEVQAGQEYWRRAWSDGDERDAWTILLKFAVAPRAAWIVEQTTPTNPAVRPPSGNVPAPQFADVPTRADGWHRAPEASSLPERWVVNLYRDGRRVREAMSEPLREGLAFTIRLSGDAAEGEQIDEFAELSADGLEVEPAVLWAYDYDEAVKAGMALSIPLDEADFAHGFERLIALGVRTGEEPLEQAADLEALLTDKNWTQGTAFVRQGTRTNNSLDGESGYPLPDPEGKTSFATYREGSLALSGGDGARFSAALGLGAQATAHFYCADRDEQTPARAMVDCLWPATLGYYLREMMAPDVKPGTAEALRLFARDHVRGRGPFAAFRIGSAPYGLLPVSALGAWAASGSPGELDHALPTALQRLLPIWLQASADVPRVGRSNDPDADLLSALSMDASAQGAQIRRALGYDAVWNLWNLHGIEPSSLDNAQAVSAKAILQEIGEPLWNPRVLHLYFADGANDFAGPLIEEGPLSETEPLAFNYLALLQGAALKNLKDQQLPPSAGPASLLYLMLRHGMLAEFDSAARDLLHWRGLIEPQLLREAELVGVVGTDSGGNSSTAGPWDRLEAPLEGVTGSKTLGEFLSDPSPGGASQPQPIQSAAERLQIFRDSLGTVATLPTAELDRLFTETLDVGAHRIDAWATGLYTKRLAELRKAQPAGVYVGCYGWLEDLQAKAAAASVAATAPGGQQVQATIDTAGYVYAPSMLHAAAAAVLRSAYLSRAEVDRAPYAIDLSSRRVRTALWLIDTVREDQPLGAALGYQFERGLHERHPGLELDKFIDAFRSLYPLIANKADSSSDPAETVAARNVVDGLRLHRAAEGGSIPFGSGDLAPSATERSAIDAELARLADSIDAIGDLLTAESVYQLIKGSVAGTAASLDTLAKGLRAPDIEVANAPRGGSVLHQRCAILLGSGDLPAEWSAMSLSPRARAAPELNAWLAGLFGSPKHIRCSVTPDGGSPREVSLADLSLQAIDFLSLAAAAEAGAADEFDRRIGWYISGASGSQMPLAIDYEAASGGSISFAQAFEIASAIGRVLGHARPLQPADLLPPSSGNRADEADLMPIEIGDRAKGAKTELEQVIAALGAAIAAVEASSGSPDASLNALREALVRASALGVAGAFPASRHHGSDAAKAALLGSGKAALMTLKERERVASGDPAAVLEAILTRSFVVVPRFKPAAPDLLATALAAEPDLGDRGDPGVEGWFAGVARVREPLAAWRTLVIYQRAFGRLQSRPQIVQLPLVSQPALARWAALPHDINDPPPSGLVSLALCGGPPPGAGDPWAALLLDAWPELTPNREEDAGVIFHHDAPGAQGPQAVLLGVTPPGSQTWSLDLVEATLAHALDLTHVRAVDTSMLPGLSQLLPTAFLAANPKRATIETSFSGLLRSDAKILAVP